MWEDPIVAEVRRAREEILEAYDFDVDAYWDHLGEIEKNKRAQGFRYVEVPFSKRTAPKPDAA